MNGLYVRAATPMIESTSSAISAAVFSSGIVRVPRVSSHAATAGTHGADPIVPATSASHSSGVRYHAAVYGVGIAVVSPAIDFRNATAPPSVSARKNTQPIITTARV